MERLGSRLRRWLRQRATGEASRETHGQGPYRTDAGEQAAKAKPAHVVFAPANGWVRWAGEDEEGLLVAGTDGLARLRPGESTPRKLTSPEWVHHHALGPRGVVWLASAGPRTEVHWLETGKQLSHRIAESDGAPDGLVADEAGVYWGNSNPDMDPDNPKVMLKANGQVFYARFDGGSPVRVARRDQHTCPVFADSSGVVWYESGDPGMVVFEATVAGIVKTTQFPQCDDAWWGQATTIDASAVYLYDRKAGGLVALPRRGGEPRLLARTRQPPLALATRDGALYAIVGDTRRAPREVWRLDLASSQVHVLGHFVADPWPHGSGYPRLGLAIGRTALYVFGGQQLLSVPRVL